MNVYGDRKGLWGVTAAIVLGGLLCAGPSGFAQAPAGRPGAARPAGAAGDRRAPRPHQYFDGRYAHDRYYYRPGYSVRHRPPGGFGVYRGPHGGRYWYRGGNWYRWSGRAWVVWGAPYGIYVPYLPPYFTTVWWYGAPYYYANDTYYVWVEPRRAYQVVAPPDGIAQAGTTQESPGDRLFVYPKSGQSSEQQQSDRYDCHRSAVEQSGFDPTVAGGGVPPAETATGRAAYLRAEASCLEARGYAVE